MDLQHMCTAMLDEVDGSLCCIVVDTQTGLTVAAEYRSGSTMDAETINLVSVIGTNMFCGKLIRQFQQSLATGRSTSARFVREVQMTTANTNQFMAAIPGWNEGIFVLVTDKSVSFGLGWMAVHRVIEQLGDAPAPSRPTQTATGNPQSMPAQQAPHVDAKRGSHQPLPSVNPASIRAPQEQQGFQASPAELASAGHSIGSVVGGDLPSGQPAHQTTTATAPTLGDAVGQDVSQEAGKQGSEAGKQEGIVAQVTVDASAASVKGASATRTKSKEPKAVPVGPRMRFQSSKRSK